MTDSGDYRDDMTRKHVTDELEDLFDAIGPDEGSPSLLAEFLQQLESLGTSHPEDVVRSRHLAMLMDEAALMVEDPVVKVSAGPLVRRRRFAFRSLVTGFLLNALIGTVAFAAVGAGAAVASDGATPGDLFYGLDRALERVGINSGGAEERIEEAMALVGRGQHRRAMETVQEAIEDLAGDPTNATAIEALRKASEQVATVRNSDASGYQETQAFRDQVAGLLGVIATEMEDGKVDGVKISETARGFSETAQEFAESRGGGPGDSDIPPGQSDSDPGNKPETPPGENKKPDTQGQPN